LNERQSSYFSTIIISNITSAKTNFIFNVKYVNVNMYVPNRTLKETLVLMCFASHFDTMECWKVIVGHRVIYYEKKKLNYFRWVEVRILVENWNIYKAHIFFFSFVQICWLETTSLYLNTRLTLSKKFPNSHNFIAININVWLLMCSPLMTTIILCIRRPNYQ
jgi:hypothetical protein